VISPEGCAAILWKDRKYAPEAATALKVSAPDLKQLGIIDIVIPEPLGGAHNDLAGAAESLKNAILASISELSKVKGTKLLEDRYKKFRALGQFTEN
jgi:acetyl-CoA carboxylase carboxyl transferase subunit alpha